MQVILSIKPEYAARILDGTKKFEFRKAGFSIEVTSALIYATKPIGKVVGEFDIETIYVDAPGRIWDRTKKFAGVKKAFFDEYFKGRNHAVAIAVGNVRKYEVPLAITTFGAKLTAPQSFCYLRSESESRQLALQLKST